VVEDDLVTTPIALNLCGVGKSFRGGPLFGTVDVALRRGELVQLSGPNGSGKTTLLRMIAGLDGDHTGTIEVVGLPAADATCELAYLPSDEVAWPTMTVGDQLRYVVRRNGCSERWWPSRALIEDTDSLMALFSDEMSAGQRRRLTLALVLAVPAEVILLDEPWASLDAETCGLLDGVVADLAAEGVTIVAVTHQLRDLPWSVQLRFVDGAIINDGSSA
jgi:ABC-type multidrug transport system ATPase subunit